MYDLVTLGNQGYSSLFSSFFNRNIYGAFLASILQLVFLSTPSARGGWDSIWRGLTGVVIVAGINLSFSKGAWLIAFLVSLCLCLLHIRRRMYDRLVSLAAALVIGVAMGAAVDRFFNRSLDGIMVVPQGYSDLDHSAGYRWAFWRNALAIGARAPLLGRGYGTFVSTHVAVAR